MSFSAPKAEDHPQTQSSPAGTNAPYKEADDALPKKLTRDSLADLDSIASHNPLLKNLAKDTHRDQRQQQPSSDINSKTSGASHATGYPPVFGADEMLPLLPSDDEIKQAGEVDMIIDSISALVSDGATNALTENIILASGSDVDNGLSIDACLTRESSNLSDSMYMPSSQPVLLSQLNPKHRAASSLLSVSFKKVAYIVVQFYALAE